MLLQYIDTYANFSHLLQLFFQLPTSKSFVQVSKGINFGVHVQVHM